MPKKIIFPKIRLLELCFIIIMHAPYARCDICFMSYITLNKLFARAGKRRPVASEREESTFYENCY